MTIQIHQLTVPQGSILPEDIKCYNFQEAFNPSLFEWCNKSYFKFFRVSGFMCSGIVNNIFFLGFYRKDHLRKHTRSHIARRVKSEVSSQSVNGAPNISQNTLLHGS